MGRTSSISVGGGGAGLAAGDVAITEIPPRAPSGDPTSISGSGISVSLSGGQGGQRGSKNNWVASAGGAYGGGGGGGAEITSNNQNGNNGTNGGGGSHSAWWWWCIVIIRRIDMIAFLYIRSERAISQLSENSFCFQSNSICDKKA